MKTRRKSRGLDRRATHKLRRKNLEQLSSKIYRNAIMLHLFQTVHNNIAQELSRYSILQPILPTTRKGPLCENSSPLILASILWSACARIEQRTASISVTLIPPSAYSHFGGCPIGEERVGYRLLHLQGCRTQNGHLLPQDGDTPWPVAMYIHGGIWINKAHPGLALNKPNPALVPAVPYFTV